MPIQYPASTTLAPAMRLREFILLCAALMAMNSLSIDPMLPALPAMAHDLRMPHANDRQLIISVYFLGTGIGALFFGALSDRYGRKPVLGSATVLFIAASVACATAPSFPMLLIGRGLAGFFAGASRVITVSLIRDRFHGDEMARVMSLIFSIFIVIPVLAPSFGQAILWVAPWRWIFWALSILSLAVLVWMLVRLPETLLPENRIPISARAIGASALTILTTRQAIGYMLASGVVMSGMIGFVVSIQQILFDVFDAARIFPIAFAAMAGAMGIGGLANSRLVSIVGARRLSQGAVILLIIISLIHLAIIFSHHESLASFMIMQASTMLCVAFTSSNFSSISMEPFSKGAGVASSFQACLTTAISSVLGGIVGRAFNGTVIPFTLGLLGFGTVALVIILWAEQGRLFTRPHHEDLREIEF